MPTTDYIEAIYRAVIEVRLKDFGSKKLSFVALVGPDDLRRITSELPPRERFMVDLEALDIGYASVACAWTVERKQPDAKLLVFEGTSRYPVMVLPLQLPGAPTIPLQADPTAPLGTLLFVDAEGRQLGALLNVGPVLQSDDLNGPCADHECG